MLTPESMSNKNQTERVAAPVSPRSHAPPAPGEPPPAARTQQRMARIGTVLALQARALSHARFNAAATAVTTELCAMLECDRVSIGFYRKGRIAIAAISNTGDFRKRQSLVRLIVAAMEEALDQQTTIVHPTPQGSSPKVTLAHARLAEGSVRGAICTVPIADRDRLLGAVLLEGQKGYNADAVRLVQDVALFVGPVLVLKHRVDDSFARRWEDMFAKRGQRLHGAASSPGKFVLLAVLALAIGAAMWPATFRITAPARIEGAIERVVAAPVDGFLREVNVRPGQAVKIGQALAALEDRDLMLERDKWEAEIAQLDKQYREALSKDDPASIVITKAKHDQARTELGLVQQRLARTRLAAPIDGVVIKGDLLQSIGAPVKRGQTLMVVAPANEFRVILEVDEQDISAVRVGQQARVLFAAETTRPFDLQLNRVAPIALARDGRNFFEAEAHVAPNESDQVGGLRPGLQGVAKIDVDDRPLIAIWTHRAANWLRRMLWRALA